MAKRRREPDSDGVTTEATAEYNTVFVDTSLDTHLAMLVSSFDTVSDFKRKLMEEHRQCFPNNGNIYINSLKVKRKAKFYHLPDIMLVWSAFQGVEGNWFLAADASGAPIHHLNPNSSELGTNILQTPLMALPDGVTKKNLASEMIPGPNTEKSMDNTTEFQSNDYSEENCLGTESRAKKKRKTRHKDNVCHNPSLEDGSTLFHASGNDTMLPKIVGHGNSMVDAAKEATARMNLLEQQGKPIMSNANDEVSGVRNVQCDIETGFALEGTSAPDTAEESNLGSIVNSKNLLASDRKKEDTLLQSIIPETLMVSKLENELGQDVPTEHSGGVSIRVPDCSGAMGDVNSDGNKRKIKKPKKTPTKIHFTTDMEQSTKDDSIKPYTETHKSDKKDEGKGLFVNCDDEVIMPLNMKGSDHADPDSLLREASFSSHFCDANAIMEPEISSGSKKKKKKKKKGMKSVDTNIEKSGIVQTDNGVSGSSGLLCPPTVPEETDKDGSISYHKGNNVHMTLLDSSTQDTSKKVSGADENEADILLLTQTAQVLDDVDTGNKGMEEKSQNSAGNCHADFPVIEKENAMVEFNEVEKDIKNPESKNEKVKHKRKKRKLTASDIQKNLPVEDQKVGIEALTTENSTIPTDRVPEETNKDTILYHEGKDVQMTLFDISTQDTSEKVRVADRSEADFVLLTQTKQALDDVDTGNKKMEEKTQSSAGNCHADLPAIEKENAMVEFNEVEKDVKNPESKNEKAKHKRKKRKLTASDAQEHLPVKDQNAGIEALTTEENSSAFLSSEQEGRHIASMQVLTNKGEEKLEEMHVTHVISAITDDPARIFENEGEGINFKEYFVPGQSKDKGDSVHKKATKSNKEINTTKRVREDCLDSAHNFARDEVIPNSSRRSSIASVNGVKDNDPSEIGEMTLQKPKEIHAAFSRPKEKYQSLGKSSSKKSEMFPEKRGNKSSQLGLNGTNMILMKTPKKKSLLIKQGAIFQDISGESSGDEARNVHLDVRAGTLSDSSSTSGDSVAESDLSQDSTRNGANDVKGRSAEGKNMSKLELSASQNLTMDMILKSSKRFKKAKLRASQNEVEESEIQPIEFVPDSQPI